MNALTQIVPEIELFENDSGPYFILENYNFVFFSMLGHLYEKVYQRHLSNSDIFSKILTYTTKK